MAKIIELAHGKKQAASPLTPELREFIDAAIVPILVREFLALSKSEPQQLAERLECVAKSSASVLSEGARHP